MFAVSSVGFPSCLGFEPASVDQSLRTKGIGQLSDHGTDVAVRKLVPLGNGGQLHNDPVETGPAYNHLMFFWGSLERAPQVIDNYGHLGKLLQ